MQIKLNRNHELQNQKNHKYPQTFVKQGNYVVNNYLKKQQDVRTDLNIGLMLLVVKTADVITLACQDQIRNRFALQIINV